MAEDVGKVSEKGKAGQEKRVRELNELLQELRLTLPGVQVLFAFLLVAPLNPRFTELADYQRNVYFFALLCSAVAAIMLIAPTAHHRLLWREHAREERLRVANGLTIAGTVFLALAMSSVLFVIADFLFDFLLAAGVVAGIIFLFGWIWYGIPLWQRMRG